MVLRSQFISSVRQPALIMQNKASVLLLVTHSIGYKTLLDFTLIVLVLMIQILFHDLNIILPSFGNTSGLVFIRCSVLKLRSCCLETLVITVYSMTV